MTLAACALRHHRSPARQEHRIRGLVGVVTPCGSRWRLWPRRGAPLPVMHRSVHSRAGVLPRCSRGGEQRDATGRECGPADYGGGAASHEEYGTAGDGLQAACTRAASVHDDGWRDRTSSRPLPHTPPRIHRLISQRLPSAHICESKQPAGRKRAVQQAHLCECLR